MHKDRQFRCLLLDSASHEDRRATLQSSPLVVPGRYHRHHSLPVSVVVVRVQWDQLLWMAQSLSLNQPQCR
jgi:hypothetical protein